MSPTELDLRQLYADLADEAPDGAVLLARLGDAAAAPVRPTARMRSHGHRLRWAGVGVAAAAAVAVAAVVLVPDRGSPRDGRPVAGTTVTRPGPASQVGTPTSRSAVPETARGILALAAVTAAADPDVVPRPDQFLYVKAGNGESWLSMDGTHDGQLANGDAGPIDLHGCRNGQSLQPGDYPGLRPQPCTPMPAYIADLPTTEAGMISYLERVSGSDSPNTTGKQVAYLLEFSYLRPAVKAALFAAATHLNGISVVDPAGPELIGVRWSFDPADTRQHTTLLFNRTTHEFAGIETTGDKGEAGSTDAPTTTAIVDHVGQRP